jgi:hypothetical protein
MRVRNFLPLVAAPLLVAGCGSISNSKVLSGPGDVWYAVSVNQTSFYRYGPQQGNGPDQQLARDSIMKVIRPSFGYVKVKLQDGESGYVANDDIRPASPVLVAEKLAPRPEALSPDVGGRGGDDEQFALDSNDPRLAAPPEPLPEVNPTPPFRY